jgi:hypothetical protein
MSDLRSLVEAAKADAPSAAARAKVWAGVSRAVGAATAAGSGAGGAVAGSLSAAKMLVVGALFGGTLAVGIGAAMLFLGHPRLAPAAATMAAGAPAEGAFVAIAANEMAPAAQPVAADEADLNAPAVTTLTTVARPLGVRMAPAVLVPIAPAEAGRKATASRAALVNPASPDDTLAREASQLAEARKALVRSDALSALQIVRGLSSLPARQLVPEELAVEAQALRGLGLNDDASHLETTLHERFPDSVLGR